MRCEICGVREGIPTIVIVNNIRTTRYVCRECSLRKMAERENALRQRQMEDDFGDYLGQSILAQQFGAILPFMTGMAHTPQKPLEYTCAKCGRSSEEFRQTSLVGCPYCYEAFKGVMKQVIMQCQTKTTHVGKAPHGENNVNAEYERLLKLLDKAVFEENYLEAARIQKELENLKNK